MILERLHKSEKKVLSTIKPGPNVAFPLPLCNLTINLYTFYLSILMPFKQLKIFFTHWKTLKALQKVMNNHRPWNSNSTSFHKLKMLWTNVWVHTLRPVSVREILHCYCPLSLFFSPYKSPRSLHTTWFKHSFWNIFNELLSDWNVCVTKTALQEQG